MSYITSDTINDKADRWLNQIRSTVWKREHLRVKPSQCALLIIDMVNHFADKGYETTVNIMAISTALQPDLEEGLAELAESQAKAVYVVDSFGSLFSEQIHFLVELYSKYLKPKGKEVGFHGHNNQQLGFANTIEAIRKDAR